MNLNNKSLLAAGVGAVLAAGMAYSCCRKPKTYPYTRRESLVETLHGVEVADPYRWLEDPDSAETQAWVEAQNRVTAQHLAKCSTRDQLRERLKKTLNYERYGTPHRRGSRYVFSKNDGLQNQSVLYKQETLDAEPEVLLDPNLLSEDGTAALGAKSFSEDGELMAYGVSRSGSDWVTIHVMRVADCVQLEEQLDWVKFSGMAWTHDNQGFFYGRYPKPQTIDPDDPDFKRGSETQTNANQALYYHRVGTPQSEDVCVYKPAEENWISSAEVSDDGQYVCVYISESTDPVNRLYYAKLADFDPEAPALDVIKLVDNFDAEYDYITNEGSVFYFKTNLDAPRGKLVSIDFENPGEWTEIVAHDDNKVINFACPVNQDKILLCYMADVKEELVLIDLSGSVIKESFDLPCAGQVVGLSARKEDDEFFYKFSSFLYPGTIFRYDFTDGSTTVFRETEIDGFDSSLYETKQVFYPSADGTKIPMFIIHRKGVVLDGNNPTLLYGYGGFNIPLLPSFSVSRLTFVSNLGGVMAIANLRGGGEYGEEWHKAGTKLLKQNVFDDFQMAAIYLIGEKYTSRDKLAIMGGSNGGLLVGACCNQRPNLFKCAIAQCGVLDMLRFHKFTIGHFWRGDYGDPDNEADFHNLLKYSPIHNVRKGVEYPAMMLTTADHDDRVVPLHSYKHIATLQHELGDEEYQKNPLLIRIETKAGHGAGKPLSKVIDELADEYGFIAYHVGAEFTE